MIESWISSSANAICWLWVIYFQIIVHLNGATCGVCVCVCMGNRCYFALLSTGGELLASAGDEWRAHRASLSALLPAGLGISGSGHHCSGRRLARRIRMVNPQRVRTGARRRVSAAVHERKTNWAESVFATFSNSPALWRRMRFKLRWIFLKVPVKQTPKVVRSCQEVAYPMKWMDVFVHRNANLYLRGEGKCVYRLIGEVTVWLYIQTSPLKRIYNSPLSYSRKTIHKKIMFLLKENGMVKCINVLKSI